MTPGVVLVPSAGLGLVIGSFLNVVVYRLPRGESLVRPASHCVVCSAPVRRRHNVPVLGWLVLRGRCADCGTRISARYPLVEGGTAVLFGALAWRLGELGLLSALPALLCFAAAGLALALVDLDTRRLPTAMILPAYAAVAVLLAASAWAQGQWWPLARAGIAAAGMTAGYLVLWLAWPGGLGDGDVRLAGLLGLVTGYLSVAAVVVGAAAGFVFGAVVGLVLMAAGVAGRRSALPFGPFMVAGALFAVFTADALADLYPVG